MLSPAIGVMGKVPVYWGLLLYVYIYDVVSPPRRGVIGKRLLGDCVGLCRIYVGMYKD